MNNIYTIQSEFKGHYEPVENGEFDSLEEAEMVMDDLEENLGWSRMRIVDQDGRVVSVGFKGFKDFNDLSDEFMATIDRLSDECFDSIGYVVEVYYGYIRIEEDRLLGQVVRQFDAEDYEGMSVSEVEDLLEEQIEDFIRCEMKKI